MGRTSSTARKKKAPALRCALCSAELIICETQPGFWLHPESEKCSVWIADADGISVDDDYEVSEDGVVYQRALDGDVASASELDGGAAAAESVSPGEALLEAQLRASAGLADSDGSVDPLMFTDSYFTAGAGTPAPIDRKNPTFVVDIEALIENPYTSSEYALVEIFAAAGVPRLGGASGTRGWSAISTFQKCPYLYRRRYRDSVRGIVDRTPKMPALEIGTLIHVFVAVGYMGMIDPNYPLTQTQIRDELFAKMVNPEHVNEAWRVVSGYWAYYQHDGWKPLAIEHLVIDPKTGDSCRIDVVVELEEPLPGFPVGVYYVDHKSAARFDQATLEGWPNDGEIIGLVDIGERIKLNKLFGNKPFQGVIINILGKQKDLQFERKLVMPSKALVKDHRKSLKIWNAAIETANALDSYPRARAACVQRYGYLCDEFDHCVQRED